MGFSYGSLLDFFFFSIRVGLRNRVNAISNSISNNCSSRFFEKIAISLLHKPSLNFIASSICVIFVLPFFTISDASRAKREAEVERRRAARDAKVEEKRGAGREETVRERSCRRKSRTKRFGMISGMTRLASLRGFRPRK